MTDPTTHKLWRKARRRSGVARFERTSTRCVMEGRYRKRAWRVPGTRENGQWSMLRRRCQDIYRNLTLEQS
jgi:hypothetical protein|tara:strand:+ start:1634 stop:1846 length:213 start_codon:yes stop_codon:yes gene_type:complete